MLFSISATVVALQLLCSSSVQGQSLPPARLQHLERQLESGFSTIRNHHLRRQFDNGSSTTGSTSTSYKSLTVELPVDHFNGTPGTFQNRYWIDASMYKSGGPVVIDDQGEADGAPDGPNLERDLAYNTAKAFNGILIHWEHRYYGKSLPTLDPKIFGPDGTTNEQALVNYYQFLTVDQALEDMVSFASNFTYDGIKDDLTAGSTPWIFTGSSYPGARAAWIRERNPDVVYISLASSAPVNAQIEFPEYIQTVKDYMTGHGYQNCTADLAAWFQWMNEVVTKNDIQAYKDFANQVAAASGSSGSTSSNFTRRQNEDEATSDISSPADMISGFERMFEFIPGNYQYFGMDGGIGAFCDFLQGTVDPITGGFDNSTTTIINGTSVNGVSTGGSTVSNTGGTGVGDVGTSVGDVGTGVDDVGTSVDNVGTSVDDVGNTFTNINDNISSGSSTIGRRYQKEYHVKRTSSSSNGIFASMGQTAALKIVAKAVALYSQPSFPANYNPPSKGLKHKSSYNPLPDATLNCPQGSGSLPSDSSEITQCEDFLNTNETSWSWQFCTELGFMEIANASDPNGLSPAWNNRTFYETQNCYNSASAQPNLKPETEFGGFKGVNPSNTFFVDGEFDPWRKLSLNSPNSDRTPTNQIPAANQVPGNDQFFGYVVTDLFHGAVDRYPGVFDNSTSSKTKLSIEGSMALYPGEPANAVMSSLKSQQMWLDAVQAWLPKFEKHSITSAAKDGPSSTSTGGASGTATATPSPSHTSGAERMVEVSVGRGLLGGFLVTCLAFVWF